MNCFKLLPLISAMAFITSNSYADVSFPIKNNTGFYINAKDSAAGCPTQIAPGATATSSEYWCGFVACATKDFDKDKGCMEPAQDPDTHKTILTEGGYASWFSISFGGKICTVPDGNIYQCQYNNNNELTFNYLNVTQKYSAGPNVGQPVTVATPTTFSKGPLYRGVNISGLEYDGTFLDAMYQHPDLPDVRYFADQGMNTIRLPIRWEFIVSTTANNAIESTNPTSPNINAMYLDSVYDTVEKYLKSGLTVDLDLHNYMRFCKTGATVGQANEPTDPIANNCDLMTGDQLAYIWGVIAKRFAPLASQYPDHLMFELMNEPYTFVDDAGKPVAGQTIKTADLLKSEVAAVNAIRKYAKDNYILLSGNYWDPLHGWLNNAPIAGDVPNGAVFNAGSMKAAGLSDQSRIVIDMHQYFDSNYSGTHRACIKFDSYSQFKQVMSFEDAAGNDVFGKWIKDNNMKIFLGEFGGSNDQNCKEDLNYMLTYISEHAYDAQNPNAGGFIGWTVWRGNRHSNGFNFLQAADYNVYGAKGSKDSSDAGTGIAAGEANSLMLPDPVFSFSKYLK